MTVDELNALSERSQFKWARTCAFFATLLSGKQYSIDDFMGKAKEQTPEDMLAVVKQLDAGLKNG